jgi:hypothetical protein
MEKNISRRIIQDDYKIHLNKGPTSDKALNFLFGRDDDYSIHSIHLEDRGSYIFMYGSYYRSLLKAFNVKMEDTITFTWDVKDIYLMCLSILEPI